MLDKKPIKCMIELKACIHKRRKMKTARNPIQSNEKNLWEKTWWQVCNKDPQQS